MNQFVPVARSPAIDLAATRDFDLGGMAVHPALRRVEMAGVSQDLEPRVMQVLVALAAARPAVVSRDRLIEICWEGRIVGDDAVNRCILALRRLTRDFSPAPFAIETVPRIGHRLIERAAIEAPAATGEPPHRRLIKPIVVLAVLAIACIAGVLLWRGARSPDPASIAVLPFRNLSSGDPYFAEGVSEEILNQLSREPHFRVVGRTSAAMFRNAADLRDVGRKLGVAYILEGSVRSQRGRVRVDASLVQASNGVRLWSDSYDRDLDDIFAIQNAIGASVAGSLKRTILKTAPLAGPLVTRGDNYELYLRARGLIKTRSGRLGQAAVAMLREVIRRDPGYAPGWSSLAQAIRLDAEMGDNESIVAATREAQRYARHALALAPDLAEAHGVLGMLLGFKSREAQYHIRRAAALAPNNEEFMFWLGNAEGVAGNYAQQRAAYQRTAAIDPFWFRSVQMNAMADAKMGRRSAADAIAVQKFAADQAAQHMLLALIAAASGDWSEAIRRYAQVAQTDSRWHESAQNYRQLLLLRLELARDRRVPPSNECVALTMTVPPSAAEWRLMSDDTIAADVREIENLVAAKRMLNAGRVAELVATSDRAAGLLGFRRSEPFSIARLNGAPLAALALRRGGRTAAADRLLADADAAVQTVYRRGPAPFRFDADAAAVAAVRGQKQRALALLERAYARGWRHIEDEDLPRLVDEPAFASLHEEPRFKAIEARLDAWFAQEKRETAALAAV